MTMRPHLREDPSIPELFGRAVQGPPRPDGTRGTNLAGVLAVCLGAAIVIAVVAAACGLRPPAQASLNPVENPLGGQPRTGTGGGLTAPPAVPGTQGGPGVPPLQGPRGGAVDPPAPAAGVLIPFSVPAGGTRQVPAGITCAGDVIVNGERWYDSDASTALVIYFQQAAQVTGPYGFSCAPGDLRTEECGRKVQYEGFRSCQPNNSFPR
jgi:hypothetical protein